MRITNTETYIVASVLILWIVVLFSLGAWVMNALKKAAKAKRRYIISEEKESFKEAKRGIEEFNQSIN